eukprot:576125-Prymnesium_polylepis.1
MTISMAMPITLVQPTVLELSTDGACGLRVRTPTYITPLNTTGTAEWEAGSDVAVVVRATTTGKSA